MRPVSAFRGRAALTWQLFRRRCTSILPTLDAGCRTCGSIASGLSRFLGTDEQGTEQRHQPVRWVPYQNVSDWPVYPGIPVLVQYHAGIPRSGRAWVRPHFNFSPEDVAFPTRLP